jgi:colicin import membrane protein
VRDKAGRGGWSFVSLSVLLHAGLVAAIVGVWLYTKESRPVEQRLALEATVVSPASPQVAAPPPSEPVQQPEPPQPQPVDDTAAREKQEREKAEAEAAHVAEERRVADERKEAERKDAELKAERKDAERKAQEEADRRKAEQVARDKAAADKAAADKTEKEKADRDKAEREKQAKLAREKTQRESELNAQIAAEEHAASVRASGAMAQYVAQITARIERAWIRPSSARTGLDCELRVTQVPGGVVTAVQITRCNGDDSVRQSIEAAVYRASPLPQPQDASLFERNLVVTFRPAD